MRESKANPSREWKKNVRMIKNGKVGNCWRGLYDAHVQVSVLRACRPFVMSASTSGLVSSSSSSKDARPTPGFHRALLDQRRQKSGPRCPVGTGGKSRSLEKRMKNGRFFAEPSLESKLSIQFLSVVERVIIVYNATKEKGIRAIFYYRFTRFLHDVTRLFYLYLGCLGNEFFLLLLFSRSSLRLTVHS